MTIDVLVLWSLITWRLVALFVYDSITARLRDLIGVRYDEHSQAYGTNLVASAFTCHKCLSIWVAAAIALIVFKPTLEGFISGTLALSAGSILVNKLVNGE